MGDRRCCSGCEVYTDDFNRDDTDDTDIGDWIEASNDRFSWGLTGDWEIETGQLIEEGTEDAIVIYDQKMLSYHMQAKITFIDEAIGDVFRVYIAWKDKSNHLYGEYRRIDAETYVIEAHSVMDGLDTVVDTTTSETSYALSSQELIVCNSQNGFYVFTWHDAGKRCFARGEEVEIPGGVYAGIGNGNGYKNAFDTWEVMDADNGVNHCQGCMTCYCHEDDDQDKPKHYPPYKLTAVFQETPPGFCDPFENPIEVELELKKCNIDFETWFAKPMGTGTWFDGIEITLMCGNVVGGSDLENSGWSLTLWPSAEAPPGWFPCGLLEGNGEHLLAHWSNADSTCYPLMLIFRYHLPTDPEEDPTHYWQFKVTVTE